MIDKALRERAARHGYRIRRRAGKYELLGEDGQRQVRIDGDLNYYFDHLEKCAREGFTIESPCGSIVDRYSSSGELIDTTIDGRKQD
jgi:hypothetical protein